MQEWLRNESLNVLAWPSQTPVLNLISHLWTDLKIAVQRRSPSNLIELEKNSSNLKYRFAKLVASQPRRLEDVIAAKGVSTKYLVKGLNTYVNVISVFFFITFNTFAKKNLRTCVCLVIMGYSV
ncbi:unnamed protein product [Oncorhynchus mykiss]|uniref:Tc1-like transposase DDE domain-containing protein n=1 Tax=Oncorhynchus mykiss TaxID=8022 RepID=A0A060Z8U2_ONCMY|nr:unnamed protein product [Oncorhynchus mykiss]